MNELVWKREHGKLADKRSIICEVPELLMEILEYDYSAPGAWGKEPEDPIEIRYYWGRHQRGEAWVHLKQHAPVIVVERDGEEERFMPLFEKRFNPYRKAHGADYWAWYVIKWELIPPPMEEEDATDAKAN